MFSVWARAFNLSRWKKNFIWELFARSWFSRFPPPEHFLFAGYLEIEILIFLFSECVYMCVSLGEGAGRGGTALWAVMNYQIKCPWSDRFASNHQVADRYDNPATSSWWICKCSRIIGILMGGKCHVPKCQNSNKIPQRAINTVLG